MPLLRSNTADKFIVDRRRPHRNSEVARAVRKTRDLLAQQPGSLTFERELLKVHARAMSGSAIAIPLLLLLITAAGFLAGVGRDILTWALISVAGYALLAAIARRIDRVDAGAIDVEKTRNLFLAGHFASGIGWSYLALIACDQCRVDEFPVIKGMVLLVAVAATALTASSVRGALAVTFVLPVAVYTVTEAQFTNPVGVSMVALLILALPFFDHVARHMNRSSLMLLSFRSEKDALIAEVETATAMSDEARRRAEDANLAKSRFLASMSHELRTPLNAILGFSEVMGKEVLGPMSNPTYRDYANDIHASGEHLLDLINEILDLSRIEAGRYQLNEEPVDVASVAEECCHLMELRARTKDIRVVQRFEPSMPRLLADERAVRQILLNLLSNAVKFVPTGGEVEVRVGWTAGGGQYISVRDNGPGIPEEEIAVVLSAFGQGSIAIKSAEQGTGLGLPIVQGLLQLHGGEFELRSRLREGTEAIAIFPPARVLEPLPAYPTRQAQAGRF